MISSSSSKFQDEDTNGDNVSSQITVQFFNENKEEDGDSISNEDFDITEYEKKLYDNTKQTIDLIGDLCSRSEQITGQQKEALLRLVLLFHYKGNIGELIYLLVCLLLDFRKNTFY